MTMIQLIACIGMIAGLFMVLGISPAEMSDSIFSRLTAAPGSIRADINETTKRKKAGFFRREITEAQAVLAASGREGKFPMVCMASLVLFALGACIAILAGNAFLVPVLAVGFHAGAVLVCQADSRQASKRMWPQSWKRRCRSSPPPISARKTSSRRWRKMSDTCTTRCKMCFSGF